MLCGDEKQFGHIWAIIGEIRAYRLRHMTYISAVSYVGSFFIALKSRNNNFAYFKSDLKALFEEIEFSLNCLWKYVATFWSRDLQLQPGHHEQRKS